VFSQALLEQAAQVLAAAEAAAARIATVETCTAGLISACLTSVPGASQVFERGFVLYHSTAKASGLGVSESLAHRHGAVSAAVTEGLAEGALEQSQAGFSIALTGYAGPGGGNERDPVGTVYVAAAARDGDTLVERHVFAGDRETVRLAGVAAALDLLYRRITDTENGE